MRIDLKMLMLYISTPRDSKKKKKSEACLRHDNNTTTTTYRAVVNSLGVSRAVSVSTLLVPPRSLAALCQAQAHFPFHFPLPPPLHDPFHDRCRLGSPESTPPVQSRQKKIQADIRHDHG
jgi:hypothetical protein